MQPNEEKKGHAMRFQTKDLQKVEDKIFDRLESTETVQKFDKMGLFLDA